MIGLKTIPYRKIYIFLSIQQNFDIMVDNTSQVPFRITDINLGFQEAEGLIRFERNRVVIEYRIKDALGLSIKSDVKELHLSLNDLSSLEIKDWWITLRLTLSVKSMRSIEDLPNAHSGEVTMKVARKHRKALRNFVSNTRLALSEYRLNELEG